MENLLAAASYFVFCSFPFLPPTRTFYPMWVVLMKSVEERFALHEQYLTQLANIAKDVSDYGSKLDDKLKQNVRGETGGKAEREREGGRERERERL